MPVLLSETMFADTSLKATTLPDEAKLVPVSVITVDELIIDPWLTDDPVTTGVAHEQ
jgi:hypothetical protein